MSAEKHVDLSNGVSMPMIGYGTWPIPDGDAEQMVVAAIDAGYRLIDTAEMYRNEEGVGRGLRAGGVERDELFVTTKLSQRWHGYEEAQEAFANQLQTSRARLSRLVPDPLAESESGEVRRRLARDDRVAAAGKSQGDRSLQLQAVPPTATHRRDRGGPPRQSDPAQSLGGAGGGTGVPQPTWHRHRVVGTDR